MNSAFIGRDHPVAVLRAEVDRVRDSHGGLVLVTGEAGIGKTTLVTTAADEARRQGTLVLSGSCWDSESVPGLWPWVQVVRALRRVATEQEWAHAETAAGSALPVLLGEQPGEGAEFPVFDAVTSALVAVSQHRPIMVVLDDLHWADAASVKLLAFAAQHAWFERLLLVGTYRDVDIEATGHPLEPLILALVAKASTLTLTGLTRDEVGDLIALTGVGRPDPAMVAEVHRRTGGNPFFVEQTARLWHSSGSAAAVPPGVRDAVRRRLAALPEQTRGLLAEAAVLGREFDVALLAAMTREDDVERGLGRAIAARLVAAAGEGRYAFVHDLVRESLAEVDESGRRAAHAAVAHALDADPALAATVFPADRARHAHAAGPAYPADRAVDLLLAAARDARGRLTLEEAAAHLNRALDLAPDGERRVMVLVDLVDTLLHSVDRELALLRLREAAEVARGLDSPEPLARVAVTLHRHAAPELSRLTDEVVREAHRRLVGPAADATVALDVAVREMVIRATALARTGADDETLTMGLWAHHDLIWGLGTARERVRLTAELSTVAKRGADTSMAIFATSLRWVALLELGDPAYLRQARESIQLARDSDAPRNNLFARIDQSILDTNAGRFAAAGALLDEVSADPACQHMDYASMADMLRWAWLLRQGRFAEIDTHFAEHLTTYPWRDLFIAVTAVERGRTDAALRYVRDTQPDAHPRYLGPLWLRLLAHTAAAARDPDLIARARSELADHSGAWAVSLYGCDIAGPIDLWLGLLDLADGDWDTAVTHLTAAADSAERMDAAPWALDARSWLIHALDGRGEETADLAATVIAEAGRLGMPQVTDRLRPATPEPDAPQFRRDGPVWSLSFAGTQVHVPDAKGLRDLHALLANPGTDIPAATLLGPAAVQTAGSDFLLDDRAKAEFRRRLDRLDAEIDHHSTLGNDARASTLDKERAALLDHLRQAAGLSGRTRRLGDEAERARKAVTARIRDTLRKLDERHPPLAAHLRSAITTGTACRYDGELSWQLK